MADKEEHARYQERAHHSNAAGFRRLSTRGFVIAAVVLVVAALFGRDAGTALVVEKTVDNPDAIVSLASHDWERLPAAAEMAQRFPSSVVVLTEPVQVTPFNCYDCPRRADWLSRHGVSPDRIHILTDKVWNTYSEADAMLRYARHEKLDGPILVVTSRYHTRRALATFLHAFNGTGIDIGILPATESASAWWKNGRDRRYVAYEWSALLYYSIRFGVSPAIPVNGTQAVRGVTPIALGATETTRASRPRTLREAFQ